MISGGSFDYDPDQRLYRLKWDDDKGRRLLPANCENGTPKWVQDAIEIAIRRWDFASS